VSAPDYFQELLQDAREQRAEKSTFEKWFRGRVEMAVMENVEAPRGRKIVSVPGSM
jgi:hypothetical protein